MVCSEDKKDGVMKNKYVKNRGLNDLRKLLFFLHIEKLTTCYSTNNTNNSQNFPYESTFPVNLTFSVDFFEY